ncbi:hypothetical protein L207DRAFT_517760 [Hyaloscypha variabilis F]|uniref:Uncharacterized protein n=1 Tax=Hyaloscypha variabilis (strain UAMH 11265 / GT02V1 / F) TaxID=1149755 RepID=A0A2J6R5B5_HYAVF|nr:hypothetical protein L207DRAFT_517760 [Hyaloscypha variabilis F]
MTSLLPLLKDLVPIVMGSSPVHVTRSADLDSSTGQTEGMIRKGAIIKKSDKLCASVMIAHPHTASAVHHHGEQGQTLTKLAPIMTSASERLLYYRYNCLRI